MKDVLAEIANGQRLERDDFEELVEGTSLSYQELMRHVEDANWYVPAAEARGLGLIAGIV